jgi:hypothetical protein
MQRVRTIRNFKKFRNFKNPKEYFLRHTSRLTMTKKNMTDHEYRSIET